MKGSDLEDIWISDIGSFSISEPPIEGQTLVYNNDLYVVNSFNQITAMHTYNDTPIVLDPYDPDEEPGDWRHALSIPSLLDVYSTPTITGNDDITNYYVSANNNFWQACPRTPSNVLVLGANIIGIANVTVFLDFGSAGIGQQSAAARLTFTIQDMGDGGNITPYPTDDVAIMGHSYNGSDYSQNGYIATLSGSIPFRASPGNTIFHFGVDNLISSNISILSYRQSVTWYRMALT